MRVITLVSPDLHALKHIEEVVHPRQMVNVLENGDEERWRDSDGTGQQHPSKTRPLQVQKPLSKRYKITPFCNFLDIVWKNCKAADATREMTSSRFSHLHHKLSRVSACHGGALTGCQNPDSPDVESCRSKETPQHHSLCKMYKNTAIASLNIYLFICQ